MKNFRVNTPGAQLAVREHGEASRSPAVLIHGGPGLVGYMAGLVPTVQEYFRVLDYDQRGAGASSRKGPFRVADHVADLDSLLQQTCGEQSPVLIGHSWGAVVALAWAAAYPQRRAHLLLIGCAPLVPGGMQRLRQNIEARLEPWEVLERNRLLERLGNSQLSETERERADIECSKLLLRVYQHDRTLRMPAFSSYIPAKAEAGLDWGKLRESGKSQADLARIRIPIFALHGREDVVDFRDVRDAFTAMGITLEFRELPEIGHTPWQEANAETAFTPHLRYVLERWSTAQPA